jgi:predicted dehydrogenase
VWYVSRDSSVTASLYVRIAKRSVNLAKFAAHLSTKQDDFTSIFSKALILKEILCRSVAKTEKWTTLVHFSDDFTSFDRRLGKLVGVMGSAVFYKPDDYFDIAPWRRQAGGGPVLINMIHEIGNLRSLCGEIVAVQAQSSNSTRGFPVEDTVAISLRFENGALGTFLLSDTAGSARSWEQTSQENTSYPSYDDEDCYVIAGDMGSLSVPTMRLKTYSRKQDRSRYKPFETGVAEMVRADPLEKQLAHFCDVIAGTAQPLVTVYDGIQNLRIVEAIAEAARTGAIVNTGRRNAAVLSR